MRRADDVRRHDQGHGKTFEPDLMALKEQPESECRYAGGGQPPNLTLKKIGGWHSRQFRSQAKSWRQSGDDETSGCPIQRPRNIDTLRRDGKILWKSKQVVDGKVKSREKLFDTPADFQKAVKASKIGKRADFDVHLREIASKESYARAEAILKFLRESGYERAGGISN